MKNRLLELLLVSIIAGFSLLCPVSSFAISIIDKYDLAFINSFVAPQSGGFKLGENGVKPDENLNNKAFSIKLNESQNCAKINCLVSTSTRKATETTQESKMRMIVFPTSSGDSKILKVEQREDLNGKPSIGLTQVTLNDKKFISGTACELALAGLYCITITPNLCRHLDTYENFPRTAGSDPVIPEDIYSEVIAAEKMALTDFRNVEKTFSTDRTTTMESILVTKTVQGKITRTFPWITEISISCDVLKRNSPHYFPKNNSPGTKTKASHS